MQALDFVKPVWNNNHWDLINPKTNESLAWLLFIRDVAKPSEVEQYDYFITRFRRNATSSFTYDVSPVFYVHWVNQIIFYHMLALREKERLAILEKITDDMEKKEIAKIHKESERVYEGFEDKFYKKLQEY